MKHTLYKPVTTEYATVIAVSHPLLRATGFSTIKPQEVVVLDDHILGQVVAFDEHGIDILVFSDKPVAIGSRILRTGTCLVFNTKTSLAGAVCNPLGVSLISSTSNTSIKSTATLIDVTPPTLAERTRINKQLITGYGLVDSLLPLGHGQRELIIGGRKTGKTSFLLGTALSQAKQGAHIVYTLIAKKKSEIKRVYTFFKDNGILDKVTMITSSPEDPASTITLTPFSAMAVAEQLKAAGQSTLLIFDDLTTHAYFYRELALLAKSFPGRESYPGDMFYTHARLLERAGNFISPVKDTPSVSITCLAAAEIQNDDLTDFITSNLISITDGHLFFDSHLFAKGSRPAINTYLSVTRVGKQTQTPLLRDINSMLTAFFSKYEKTKELTHFGSELSVQSKVMLERGKLLTEYFQQSHRGSYSLELSVLWITIIWLDLLSSAQESNISAIRENVLESCLKNTQLLEELMSFTSFDTLLKEMKPKIESHLQSCL